MSVSTKIPAKKEGVCIQIQNAESWLVWKLMKHRTDSQQRKLVLQRINKWQVFREPTHIPQRWKITKEKMEHNKEHHRKKKHGWLGRYMVKNYNSNEKSKLVEGYNSGRQIHNKTQREASRKATHRHARTGAQQQILRDSSRQFIPIPQVLFKIKGKEIIPDSFYVTKII